MIERILGDDQIQTLVSIALRHTMDRYPIGAMAVNILMRSDMGSPITHRMQGDFLGAIKEGFRQRAQSDGSHDNQASQSLLMPVTASEFSGFNPDFGDEDY